MIGRKRERNRGRENERKVEKQSSHHPANELSLHRAPIKPKETVSGGLDLFTEAEVTKIRALK